MSNIFPTDYSTKTTPDGTDVVWSSDAVTNFNLTVASIALYTLTNNNTDDLSEGSTNLYYTEARVTANTTVVALGNDKADKSNVLELNNTTAFTPSADYQPATKKYVDDISMPSKATPAEVVTGTDDTKFVTPLGGLSGYGSVVPGATYTYLEANTERTSDTTITYTKAKEVTINKAGCYSVLFDMKSSNVSAFIFGRVYINGVAVGTERTDNATTYTTYSENFECFIGDKVQLYYHGSGTGVSAIVQNFQVKYDLVAGVTAGVVDTD